MGKGGGAEGTLVLKLTRDGPPIKTNHRPERCRMSNGRGGLAHEAGGGNSGGAGRAAPRPAAK